MPESGFAHLCALDVLERDVPRRFEVAGVPLAVPVRVADGHVYVCLPDEG